MMNLLVLIPVWQELKMDITRKSVELLSILYKSKLIEKDAMIENYIESDKKEKNGEIIAKTIIEASKE